MASSIPIDGGRRASVPSWEAALALFGQDGSPLRTRWVSTHDRFFGHRLDYDVKKAAGLDAVSRSGGFMVTFKLEAEAYDLSFGPRRTCPTASCARSSRRRSRETLVGWLSAIPSRRQDPAVV